MIIKTTIHTQAIHRLKPNNFPPESSPQVNLHDLYFNTIVQIEMFCSPRFACASSGFFVKTAK